MDNLLMKYKNFMLITGFILAVSIGLSLGYVLFKTPNTPQRDALLEHAHDAHSSETIWTCSMHPQIRQNEQGDCPICGMNLIPLKENTSSDPLILEMTPEAVKLAQIETTTLVSEGKAQKTLTLSGKIQEDERLAASQVAHIPGRIEQLYVSFKGEFVHKGQQIARIYSPELITAQQELIQAIKLKERNPSLYPSARQKLLYWKLTEDQISRIEQNEIIQETFDIYADASGVVSVRRISVGDYVQQGDVLFEVVDLSRLWILFDAYEEDLAHLSIGDEIRFTTASMPGKTYVTHVSFIDPVINPKTRTVSVRGEVSNIDLALKPEMFVKGTLISPIYNVRQLLVPKSAVLWTGKRSVVYVKEPEMNIPSFRYREVELGDRLGASYVVKSGLKPGDEVVTTGSFTIDASAQLNNQQSMMNSYADTKSGSDSSLPNYASRTPTNFQEQLAEVVTVYLSLKDALVASDAQEAKLKGQIILEKLSQINVKLLEGEVQEYWITSANTLKSHTKAITSSEELSSQREQFIYLSSAIIETLQVMGVKGESLYVQHCPMANEYQGADWLSLEEEIRNPYFGDQMLTCGSVIMTLADSIN